MREHLDQVMPTDIFVGLHVPIFDSRHDFGDLVQVGVVHVDVALLENIPVQVLADLLHLVGLRESAAHDVTRIVEPDDAP
jgi:hypothetical protein